MAKIAISLPDDVLLAVEKERQARGVSRSEFFRRAAMAFLQRQRDMEAVERYVLGYRDQPETDEELGWTGAASQEVLAAYPWDDEAGR